MRMIFWLFLWFDILIISMICFSFCRYFIWVHFGLHPSGSSVYSLTSLQFVSFCWLKRLVFNHYSFLQGSLFAVMDRIQHVSFESSCDRADSGVSGSASGVRGCHTVWMEDGGDSLQSFWISLDIFRWPYLSTFKYVAQNRMVERVVFKNYEFIFVFNLDPI